MGWRFGFGLWRMVVDKWEKGGDLLGDGVVEKFVGNEWRGCVFGAGLKRCFGAFFGVFSRYFYGDIFWIIFFEIRRIFKSVSKTTT